MKILKNKLFILTPVIAVIAAFIFSLTMFPNVQPQPKNLPIAILNLDEGLELPNKTKMNVGNTFIENIQKNTEVKKGEDSAVKWIIIKNEKEFEKGLKEQKYYAGLVIPKDMSVKQASLQGPTPLSPNLDIYINQGMNNAVSTIAGQILNTMIENMNLNIRTQALQTLKENNLTLNADQVSSYIEPIKTNTVIVNEVKENTASGNAPVLLFQPIWIASLAAAAILFISMKKLHNNSVKNNLKIKISQITMAMIISILVGFILTALSKYMVGLEISNYLDTSLFLAISSFAFIMMILGVISLIGIKGVPLFALMLFFGAPLLSMVPEMLSPFYLDYVYSWLPMKYMILGLKEIFFFGSAINFSIISNLIYIALGGLIVILLTSLKKNKTEEEIKEIQ